MVLLIGSTGVRRVRTDGFGLDGCKRSDNGGEYYQIVRVQ
jgi:hypothetical protein